jgi:uncharacterized protein YndB with AHSA1/START domain
MNPLKSAICRTIFNLPQHCFWATLSRMGIKDCDIYPKYSFRLSHSDKEWLDRELEALKTKFNAGNDGSFPVVTKNVLLMSAVKRGLRFLREDVHARCIQKDIEVKAEPSRVWFALTNIDMLTAWWQPGMTLEPYIGGKFVEPRVDSDGSDQLATGIVTEAVPNEFIQFTWKEQTWKVDEETVCSFRLRPIGNSVTRVQLLHSGWEIFPEPKVAELKKAYEAGWETLLRQLAEVLAKG